MGRRKSIDSNYVSNVWLTASYTRLSREDGDKLESDSITNQQKILDEYIAKHDDLLPTELYVDDGYTGTNFAEVR